MEVGTKALNIWRDTLHDTWNVAGIMGGIGYGADGLPYITSHYGFYMSAWYIAPGGSGYSTKIISSHTKNHAYMHVINNSIRLSSTALSGLRVENGCNITFSPKIPPPYKLPVMLPTFWGLLEAQVAPLDAPSLTQDPRANINNLFVNYNLTVHFGALNSRDLTHLAVNDCQLDLTKNEIYTVGNSALWKCSY